jgi:hypothetical protein
VAAYQLVDYPTRAHYVPLAERLAVITGLAVAAGLTPPPPLDQAGLRLEEHFPWPGSSGYYRTLAVPSYEAHERWLDQLQLLRTAAQAVADSGHARDTERTPTVPAEKVNVPDSKPALKSPPDAAVKAYRLKWILGVPKQSEIAERLSQELGKPVSQGQVSRWLKQTEEFVSESGVLPGLPDVPSEKPMPVDPERLDLGPRQDGRTERQRGRRSDDD